MSNDLETAINNLGSASDCIMSDEDKLALRIANCRHLVMLNGCAVNLRSVQAVSQPNPTNFTVTLFGNSGEFVVAADEYLGAMNKWLDYFE